MRKNLKIFRVPITAREVAEALPSLPVGTAFVCSASLGIGKRIEVRAR
jgi:hypothetical protein